MKKGRILASAYGTYQVISEGQSYLLKPRGLLRFQGVKPMVGDFCLFDDEQEMIMEILPRKNMLYRPMIANIDRAYVIMSVVKPDYSPLLVDKFLTYLLGQQIAPALIITKMDCCHEDEKMEEWKRIYESLGIPVYFSSLNDKNDYERLKEALKTETSVFIGQSGVGKSSLLNYLFPKWERKIGEYSSSLGRGKHQTKEVILLPYEEGYVADTPGFSSLDLRLTIEEISHYFPGFSSYIGQCFFRDCHHLHEKGCSLKKAVEEGRYPLTLYEHYVDLVSQINDSKRR